MNDNVLFSCTASIKIQGSRVLRLRPQRSESVNFEIVGFDDVILISDYRTGSRQSIEQAIAQNEARLITQYFNRPADLTLEQLEADHIHVKLRDPRESHPEYMMWINVGLKDSLPVYDYIYHRIAPLEESDGFALFALYRRPPYGRQVLFNAFADNIYSEPAMSCAEESDHFSYRYENG